MGQKVSQLKPGDRVLAGDTKTGKDQPEAVTVVEVHHDTNLYDLTVKTSTGTDGLVDALEAVYLRMGVVHRRRVRIWRAVDDSPVFRISKYRATTSGAVSSVLVISLFPCWIGVRKPPDGGRLAGQAAQSGDLVVLGCEPGQTGKDRPRPLPAVMVHRDTDLYDLKVKTTSGTEVIHTTDVHLFWDVPPEAVGSRSQTNQGQAPKAVSVGKAVVSKTVSHEMHHVNQIAEFGGFATSPAQFAQWEAEAHAAEAAWWASVRP